MRYRVGEVARLAHVSVRTLHHYDEVGLLVPSGRSESGYRLYTPEDLERLQHVLFYRELGFGLEEIRGLHGRPGVRPPGGPHRTARPCWRDGRVGSGPCSSLIDRTLASLEGGIQMTKDEMFEVFGDFDPSEYEDEVQERWGDTDAYRESARRTRRYTKADWARFKAESDGDQRGDRGAHGRGRRRARTRARWTPSNATGC